TSGRSVRPSGRSTATPNHDPVVRASGFPARKRRCIDGKYPQKFSIHPGARPLPKRDSCLTSSHRREAEMSKINAIVVASLGGLVTFAPALAAHAATSVGPERSVQCIYTPHLPARISIGQQVVGYRARLSIEGKSCRLHYLVGTDLIHITDQHGLSWRNP